jgi:hypothetical protein
MRVTLRQGQREVAEFDVDEQSSAMIYEGHTPIAILEPDSDRDALNNYWDALLAIDPKALRKLHFLPDNAKFEGFELGTDPRAPRS